ncbi:ATP-dependent DNA helicase Rep [Andreprevotia sp. IGB-42]|uniref:DEAD/DEAH box helicase n=1 Tax=Andreprevotia sp. IGB-42 TaxID=2497473 RepID=UPI00157EFAE5|nr:3'-5' exonuclease [Andreprevotia sp. IGB-42]KAF0813676.1 ATP-dependent DNA helicase Rep [Andreprevotia sp. IGB-42]
MATLIPNLNSTLARMTSGEKRFARRLEALLEDDYLCWYDVTVGVKRRRPDFLILNPLRGLLALEVKDWKLSSIRKIDPNIIQAEFNGRVVKEINPLLKARDFINVTIDLLKRDPLLLHGPESRYTGKLCMPYGHGVVLTNITRKDFDESGMADVMPEHLVICQDEMTESMDAEAFQSRLWNMFLQPFPCRLTLPQIDRIRWHLFPDVRIVTRQGSLFEAPEADQPLAVPDLIRVMDVQQEQLARSLGEGHRVIHGVAGSGKTMILGYRAEYLAQGSAKPILVLCFNRALAQKLTGWMAHKGLAEKVHVRTLHGWCSDMVRTYQLNRPARSDTQYAELVQEVIDGVNRKQVPAGQYSAVLIDEGHDFEPEWLRLIVQMVDPTTNALLVMYDSAQDIYQGSRKRRFSFASVGIQAQGRTTILKLNYRNTAEVLGVAYAFASELLTAREAEEDGAPLISPQTAGRHGPAPEFIQLPSFNEEIHCIAKKLQANNAEGTALRDMAVLTYRNAQVDNVVKLLNQCGVPARAGLPGKDDDPAEERVNVLTLHASKGLEFSVVAIPGLGEMPYSNHDASEQARVLYVGMTRAMNHLVMTAHRESDFAGKAKNACEKWVA